MTVRFHRVEGLAIVEKTGKRPFKIMTDSGVVSFATLEAAFEGAKRQLRRNLERNKIVADANRV